MQKIDGIQLSDMIQVLRSELEHAQTQSKHSEITFQTEKVELELKVSVTGTVKGEGGVQFWVVKAGAGLQESEATTHTFKLTFKPVSKDLESPIQVGKETDKKPAGA